MVRRFFGDIIFSKFVPDYTFNSPFVLELLGRKKFNLYARTGPGVYFRFKPPCNFHFEDASRGVAVRVRNNKAEYSNLPFISGPFADGDGFGNAGSGGNSGFGGDNEFGVSGVGANDACGGGNGVNDACGVANYDTSFGTGDYGSDINNEYIAGSGNGVAAANTCNLVSSTGLIGYAQMLTPALLSCASFDVIWTDIQLPNSYIDLISSLSTSSTLTLPVSTCTAAGITGVTGVTGGAYGITGTAGSNFAPLSAFNFSSSLTGVSSGYTGQQIMIRVNFVLSLINRARVGSVLSVSLVNSQNNNEILISRDIEVLPGGNISFIPFSFNFRPTSRLLALRLQYTNTVTGLASVTATSNALGLGGTQIDARLESITLEVYQLASVDNTASRLFAF